MFSMSKAIDTKAKSAEQGDPDELPQGRPGQDVPQARTGPGVEEEGAREEGGSEAAPGFP
jgi:hypothetical protein